MKKQVLIVSLINGLLGISQSNCLHENKRGTYTKHKHRTQKKEDKHTSSSSRSPNWESSVQIYIKKLSHCESF